ncbi:MAG TPA: hypothetical protein VFQ96_04435 [Microbacteriaceae bacterium]|nr:hypothetical protein [Microbacteriaceae bacterium]
MRKYVSVAMLGVVFGLFRLLRRTARGPRDKRLALSWLGWGVGTSLTCGSIRARSRRVARRPGVETAPRQP